jgi:hypothetical protein
LSALLPGETTKPFKLATQLVMLWWQHGGNKNGAIEVSPSQSKNIDRNGYCKLINALMQRIASV